MQVKGLDSFEVMEQRKDVTFEPDSGALRLAKPQHPVTCLNCNMTVAYRLTGDGSIQTTGNHYGPPYLRPVCPRESCCAVVARKAALQGKQH